MNREPYLVLRDFRVWFQKRRGFLEGLRRTEPVYVRAVDGIDLTVGKGEVYCLVGESGCGKTTTGKGILQLVEPAGGDVFIGLSPAELEEYDQTKARGDAEALEAFRRHHSLTYKEKTVRKPVDYARHALLATVGTVLGVMLTLGLPVLSWSLGVEIAALGLVWLLHAVGLWAVELLACLSLGTLIGFVGTYPWVKLTHRVPLYLTPFAFAGVISVQLLATAASLSASGRPADPGAVLTAYASFVQENTLFVALLEIALGMSATWYTARLFMRYWQTQQGAVFDRIKKMRKRLQIIFQDPYESLNPRLTVYDVVAEPLIVNRVTRRRAETASRVEKALHDAGLRPARDYLLRYPHELSGGQRQRVSIAGALVLDPEFIVADEPVSMLDVSIRTEIVELLLQLRNQKGLTYLFITHDLSLAWVLADRIGVMYLGKIVEEGPTEELISNPRHPYTKALISVVPVPDPDRKHERIILRGERPDPSDIPAGCRFHPRCPVAFERCGWTSDEVLAALRGLATDSMRSHLEGSTVAGPLGILLPRATKEGETWLQELVEEKSELYRSLKAIRSIQKTPQGLRIGLHSSEEPMLKTVSTGLQVACHLYA